MLYLGSLFSGSGGFELAAAQNGIKTLWNCEVEPFPIMVTHKRMPSVKHYGDVSAINGAEVEPVDIITFGSPCQDLSIAGRRAGLEDGERSNLFYQAVRIIKEMRDATNGKYPRYAVWENVPGALSSNQGRDFQSVLKSLCEVKCETDVPQSKWQGAGLIMGDDYSVAWRILDAQYWGVPQRRRRIFLVADFDGQSAGKVLFESEGVRRDSCKVREERQEVAAATPESSGGAGVTCLNDQGGDYIDGSENATSTLRAQNYGHPPVVVYSIDRAAYNQGINAKYDLSIDDSGVCSTVIAKGPSAVCVVTEDKA